MNEPHLAVASNYIYGYITASHGGWFKSHAALAHVGLTVSHVFQLTGTEDDRGGLQRSPGQESPGQVQVSF